MLSAGGYWKLGLFVVVSTGAAVAAAFWLGAATLREQRPIHVVTYFNESVQGLSEGSAVRFRGVKIGEVESIRVAGDMVRLEVMCRVGERALTRLEPPDEAEIAPRIVPDLYAQLVSSNLTGQKHVAIDVADPVPEAVSLPEGIRPPPMADVFIPSRPSTLKSVEKALENALEFFQDVGPDVGTAVDEVASVLTELRNASLPDEVRATLRRVDGAVTAFQGRVEGLDTSGLSASTIELLDQTRQSMAELQALLRSLSREDAEPTQLSSQVGDLLETATSEIRAARLPETAESVRTGADAVARAADAVTAAADRVVVLADGLDETVLALRDTIEALRSLLVVLEHDPSSILRGRTYGAPPPSIDSQREPR